MKKKILLIGIIIMGIITGIMLEIDSHNTKEKTKIVNEHNDIKKEQKKEQKQIKQENIKKDIAKLEKIKNDKYMILVNKSTHKLNKNDIPDNLVVPKIKFNKWATNTKMEKVAASAVEKMFEAAKKDRIDLLGISAYRAYNVQVEVFEQEIEVKGSKKRAEEAVAPPGSSEHQTGYTLDLTCVNRVNLDKNFEKTDDFKWLQENCYKYGFILRYPKDKEDITKYQYEPWHYRYVGVDNATYIMKNHLTLEEYIEKIDDKIENLKKKF
ncbi:D-alanyl-D-alanine carboxypeptidase [Clostridiaceae bacterium 14S0207]|nr:D-alanyl-D-alanine carboxypeptidase [Clostridiaceae bacterium 14S0207]